MIKPGAALSPDVWMRDIERYVWMERFLAELPAHGFQALKNRGEIIVFCNNEPIRKIL